MAFRLSELQKARVENPKKWKAMVEFSIQKHRGVLKRVCNDLDIGYSTLKRWLNEVPELKAVVKASRKGKRKAAA